MCKIIIVARSSGPWLAGSHTLVHLSLSRFIDARHGGDRGALLLSLPHSSVQKRTRESGVHLQQRSAPCTLLFVCFDTP
jgi:hypothetical protein